MLIRNRLVIAAALFGVASSMTVAHAETAYERNGRVIDSQGWRYTNGNWDNSCFRTLGYLSSADACAGHGGG